MSKREEEEEEERKNNRLASSVSLVALCPIHSNCPLGRASFLQEARARPLGHLLLHL